MTKISANMPVLRAALWQRCDGRCEITGAPLGDSWALHHRRPKQMGGTNRPDVHTLPNLMALTHAAHNLTRPAVHLDVAWALDRGYLLTSSALPRLEPVWLRERAWVLLTADGGYLPCTHEPPTVLATGGRFMRGSTGVRGGRE